MVSNYLKQDIEKFFGEVTSLHANLKIVDSFMSGRAKQLFSEYPTPDFNLIAMGSYYRDLSQLQGGNNLYDTKVDYHLSTNNLQSETRRVISYLSCITVAQSFEVFESLLKNLLAKTISNNIHVKSIIKIKDASTNFEKIRYNLNEIQGTSNKGFIKALGKLSPFFKSHERNNIWKRNMSLWFDMIAEVRNIVVHSRQIITPSFKKYMTEVNKRQLFNLHFTIEDSSQGKMIFLSEYQASQIVANLFEYAFLIYKSLSIDFELEVDCEFRVTKL